jgi:hypothetical protein
MFEMKAIRQIQSQSHITTDGQSVEKFHLVDMREVTLNLFPKRKKQQCKNPRSTRDRGDKIT